jgi:hypothetical protein
MKKTTITIIISVFILISISPLTAFCEEYLYGGDYMNLGTGSRPWSMGGAFVSITGDPNSIYYNPAGISTIDGFALDVMHSYNFNGLVKVDTFVGGYNLGKAGVVGGGMLRVGVDEIYETRWDEDGRPEIVRTFNWADYAIYGTYAKELLRDVLYVGASFKYLRQGGGGMGGKGVGFDVGAIVKPHPRFSIGVNFQDIGSYIKWDTGARDEVPLNIKVGSSYTQPIGAISSDLTVSVDADIKHAGYGESAQIDLGEWSMDMHYGGELTYRDMVSVRLGAYRDDFTVGAGFSYKFFNINYALVTHTELNNSHRISAGVEF